MNEFAGAGSRLDIPGRLVPADVAIADARFTDVAAKSGLTIASMLAAAWRRRLVFLMSALVTFAIAAAMIFSLRARYESSALLMVDPRETNITNIQAVQEGGPQSLSDLNFVRSQIQILTSDELARQVVVELGLQNDPAFAEPPSSLKVVLGPLQKLLGLAPKPEVVSPETAIARTTERYKDLLGASSDGKSLIIGASFAAGDPALAQRVLAAHLTRFQDGQTADKRRVIVKAESWFKGELDSMRRNLETAEARLQGFRQSNQLIRTEGETIPSRQLTAATNQLSEAQADLARKEARLQGLSEAASSGGTDTAVLGSDLIQKLRQQEAAVAQDVAQQEQRFGTSYPGLVAARAGLADVRSKIAREMQRLSASAASDVAIARANVRQVTGALSEVDQRLGATNMDELKAAQLSREIEAQGRVYDDLLLRNKQVSIQAQLQEPDTRVVSGATLPLQPAFPRRGVLLAISLVAAAVVGGLAAFLVEMLSVGKVSSLADLEGTCGIAGLAVIPQLPAARRLPAAASANAAPMPAPGTYLAAALQTLRNSVAFRCGGRNPKVIVFASALPGDGKTLLAMMYARSLPIEGRRVLLIDADLRRSGLSRIAAADKRAGLADCLLGQSLAGCVVTDQAPGLDLLPAGVAQTDPGALLAAERVSQILKDAMERYAAIIIDTPPMAVVDDALQLVAQADATVMVARWNRTPFAAVREALGRMHLAGGHVVGAALTAADMRKYRSGSDRLSAFAQHKSYYVALS